MSEVTVVEILKAGRDRVAARWIQNAYWMSGPITGYCVVGAIRSDLRSFTSDSQTECYGAALEALCRVLYRRGEPNRVPALHRWNDMPGRTQEEAVALFEEAIACLK